MAGKNATVDITITTDADQAARGFDDAAAAAAKLGDAVDDASRKVDTGADRMAGAADAADNLDDKTSKATGALGALSSGFELVGLDQYATGLQSAALATDFMSGAGQALSLVLELEAVQWVKNKVATAASTVATIAQSAATKAAAAAQWVLNAALEANPIGLAVAAVALLIAGFVLLYKRSDRFRRIVDKIWAGIKTGAAAAARVFKAVFQVAFAVVSTYVKVYLAIFKAVFHAVEDAVRTAGRVIKAVIGYDPKPALQRVWHGIEGILTSPFRAAQTVIERIADGLSGIFDGAFSGLMSAVQTVINALNSLISAFNRLPGHSDIPRIPSVQSAAAPGVASSTTSSLRRYVARPVSRAAAVPALAAAGGPTIIVQGALDPEAVARQIRKLLLDSDRRRGV